MKLTKSIFAMLCCAVLLVSAIPTLSVSAKEETTGKASSITLEDNKTDDTVANVDVPNGYTAEKTTTSYSLNNRINYRAGTDSTVYWELDGNTLTVSGYGSMDELISDNVLPWEDYKYSIENVIIEDGITDISAQAFYGCYKLKTASLGSSVETIGEAAFCQCGDLASINLPSSLKLISRGAFAYCTSLKITDEINVAQIQDYAFQDVAIENIVLGKVVETLSEIAFYGCSIKTIKIDEENSNFKVSNNTLYNADFTKLLMFPCASEQSSVTIPDGVTEIGDCAFLYCRNLTEFIFPESVTYFGISAFQYCDGLTEFTIPDSVTEVGNFTFAYCNNLKTVYFGKGLKTTSYQMFLNCQSLKNIDFGALEEINNHTFRETGLEEIVIPKSIKHVDAGAFVYCTNLKFVKILGLDFISEGLFQYCNSLESVELNEGIEEIKFHAFEGCTSLKHLTIPQSVTYINPYAIPTEVELTLLNDELQHFGKNGYRPLDEISVTGNLRYNYAFAVLEIVNHERELEGLDPLVMNSSLLETAMQRAVEISALFAHTRPDSSICFDANSLMYGENIAFGQVNPDAAMNSWMNSAGHRENILTAAYKTIGIGCFEIDGMYYWVQCFGTDDNTEECSVPSDTNVTRNIKIAEKSFEEAQGENGPLFVFEPLEEYEYNLRVLLDKSKITTTETTNATLYLKNGAMNVYIPINDYNVQWSTTEGIAEIDGNRRITPLGKGTAEITASLKYYSDTANLTIVKKTPSVSFSKSYSKTEGDSPFMLDTTVNEGSSELTFLSSDESIASVDENGMVSINGVGECTITVTSKETFEYEAFTGEINLKVNSKEIEPPLTSNPTGTSQTTEATQPTETRETIEPTESQTTDSPGTTGSTEPTQSTDTTGTTEPYESSSSTSPSESTSVTEPSATINPTENTNTTEPTETTPAKTTVNLKKSSATVYVKGTAQIKATVKNGKGKTIYKTSNKKVAKVNSSGKVTGVKKGTATITVTNNGVSKKFKITVKNPKLNKSKLTIKKGKSFKLSIKGKVGNAKFTSSNKKVATVSKKGNIKAKKKGKATITVKTNGMKLKCKIKVK